jgi:DNA repair protein RecO (recombination protein O)
MSNQISVKGLVIKTVDYRESDRIITVFTEEMGVVSAMARSARSLKSRKMSATLQYCYSNFILIKRGDFYDVKEAELIESFFDIRKTIYGLALSAYIAEVLSYVTVAEAERELLRLSLNSLYAIASGKYPLNKVKAAFEIRCATILGFMPDVTSCATCGEKNGEFFFDIMAGALECFDCHKRSVASHTTLSEEHEGHVISILSEGAKNAMCYAIYSPLEKMFSFNISDDDMSLFAKAAERYVINHLERTYKTLEFYNEVKR